jgi:hypothetical protein
MRLPGGSSALIAISPGIARTLSRIPIRPGDSAFSSQPAT